jgi:hypothetical protein
LATIERNIQTRYQSAPALARRGICARLKTKMDVAKSRKEKSSRVEWIGFAVSLLLAGLLAWTMAE